MPHSQSEIFWTNQLNYSYSETSSVFSDEEFPFNDTYYYELLQDLEDIGYDEDNIRDDIYNEEMNYSSSDDENYE